MRYKMPLIMLSLMLGCGGAMPNQTTVNNVPQDLEEDQEAQEKGIKEPREIKATGTATPLRVDREPIKALSDQMLMAAEIGRSIPTEGPIR